MSKRAVVCGQGACTAFLLSGLLEKKYKVTVIAEDPEFCRKMAEETDSRVILGDPGSPEVLEDAGIRGSQVILALGERDEDNLEICQMGTKLRLWRKKPDRFYLGGIQTLIRRNAGIETGVCEEMCQNGFHMGGFYRSGCYHGSIRHPGGESALSIYAGRDHLYSGFGKLVLGAVGSRLVYLYL